MKIITLTIIVVCSILSARLSNAQPTLRINPDPTLTPRCAETQAFYYVTNFDNSQSPPTNCAYTWEITGGNFMTGLQGDTPNAGPLTQAGLLSVSVKWQDTPGVGTLKVTATGVCWLFVSNYLHTQKCQESNFRCFGYLPNYYKCASLQPINIYTMC
jgi:hypothetical protein